MSSTRVRRCARVLTPLLLALALGGAARADERVLSYHSDITVRPDSVLEVRETIRVRAEGDQIRRGIYRDFPTVYTDRRGQRVVTGFTLVSVSLAGRRAPHHRESLDDGVRVYVGDADVLLQPGEYTYELKYRTDRQLGFFAEHDELYWNVTGNGWNFAIDEATAEVHLPADVPASQMTVEAYTGPQGARGQDFEAGIDGSTPVFATTRALAPNEGLTIVVTWPKGHVSPPTAAMQRAYLLRDSWPLAAGVAGFLALIAYYFGIWHLVGRDPPGRIVVPQYEAPEGQSAASMRYLLQMGYDDRCFAAGVLSLAVKGHLVIEQEKAGLFGLKRQFVLSRAAPGSDAKPIAADEQLLYRRLLEGRERLELVNENHETVSAARSQHRASLKRKFSPNFFRVNGGWHALGILASILIPVVAVVWPLTQGFAPQWFFTTPGLVTAGLLFAGLLTNGVFGKLLRAPTVAGREVMDGIEGFKLYLDVAEGDELKLQGAPALTPRLFETNLPAALALGVEQRWAERFATVFATQAVSSAPTWYHGDRWDARDLSGFSSSLGSSLDGAISSAATAPGSSSGSGGGGSSGGGGGGGGGGGW